EHGEEVLAAVAGGAAQLHLALEHHVELVAGVALVEEHLPTTQTRLSHRRAQRRRRLVVELAEQGRLTQYVVVHEGLLHRILSPASDNPSRAVDHIMTRP